MINTPPRIAKIFLFVIVLLSQASAFAQLDHSQFYTIQNLFSKELIKSVAKDEDGYLWIATDDGILWYDGYQTRAFYREFPDHYTKAFLKRKNGQFYVLHDFGIKEIVKENDSSGFRPLTIGGRTFQERLAYPKSVYEDQKGNLWAGEMAAVVRFNEKGMKRFDLGEAFRSIDYHRTFSFAEDAFGNLWIAPFKGPLLYYDHTKDELVPVNTAYPLTEVSGMATVKGDYLLLGGKEGIVTLKIDSDHNILEQQFSTKIFNISVLRCLNNTQVYAGTWTNGLFYFDFNDPAGKISKLDNVSVPDVVDLFYDPLKHELWVAGSEHIGLFKPTIASIVRQVGQNRIESLTIDEQNHIYYSIGKQVYYLDDQEKAPVLIRHADDTYFARILIDHNRLWIGDAFGRVSYYDLDEHKEHVLANDRDASVMFAYKDRYNNKWFTGHALGLIRIDGNDRMKYYTAVKNSVLLRESPQGELYCGRDGKNVLLSVYDTRKDEFMPLRLTYHFNCPDDLVLNDFRFDHLHNLWIATDEGLLKAAKGDSGYNVIEKVSIPGLDVNEPVRAIAVMGEFICFANAQGLVIFKDHDYILFNQDSGLPSRILKERGLEVDREGNLLVATAKGMVSLKKDAIRFQPTVSPVFKTVQVNGVLQNIRTLPEEAFPYKTKVEVEFISLSYPATNIQYQTRILGIDTSWTTPSANRNLNVLGFSEGTYRLQVRAREDGRLWSEPLTLTIRIGKPWYRTWWAILLFAGVAVIIMVTATNIHNNNLIRQKRLLQKIVDERTSELNRQKNELIEQQKELIEQKEEIITQNEAVYRSQQALNEADRNYLHLKEKQLQDQIEYKNKQITTHTLNILQKNKTLQLLRDQLEEIIRNTNRISVTELRKTLRTIDESFKLDKDWEDFKLYFEQIHAGFYSKLKVSYPDLTPLELRHCALIRLNLTLAECASILGISGDSIKVSRTRLRRKLNLTPQQSLTDFILGI